MNYKTLLTQIENGIFTITINRPEKLNALNKDVFDDLDLALTDIERDQQIRSVIITGAGGKAFVAGADISEFANYSKDQARALAKRGQDIFFRIENCSKPIVAAVNGFALGGGCELALACHFRIGSQNAKFGQPEVSLGLIPGYGGTQRLAQIIGKGRAMEMLMSGLIIDANTALEFGVINYVTFPDDLLAKTKSVLELINSKAPLAIAACIRATNDVFNETRNGFQTEINGFADCFDTEDIKEGTAAFLEKRKAIFKGK